MKYKSEDYKLLLKVKGKVLLMFRLHAGFKSANSFAEHIYMHSCQYTGYEKGGNIEITTLKFILDKLNIPMDIYWVEVMRQYNEILKLKAA